MSSNPSNTLLDSLQSNLLLKETKNNDRKDVALDQEFGVSFVHFVYMNNGINNNRAAFSLAVKTFSSCGTSLNARSHRAYYVA